MKRYYWIIGAGALVLVVVTILPLASACPPLRCSNFTDPNTRSACNDVIRQGFSRSEQQEMLCVLWTQDYSYTQWHPPQYTPVSANFTFNYHAIDTSSFIIAIKIVMILLFSYFVYCVLTRPSFTRKWFAV